MQVRILPSLKGIHWQQKVSNVCRNGRGKAFAQLNLWRLQDELFCYFYAERSVTRSSNHVAAV
mgnify:CR=1 FL=1